MVSECLCVVCMYVYLKLLQFAVNSIAIMNLILAYSSLFYILLKRIVLIPLKGLVYI